MHVEGQEGRPVPTQTKELGHWPDGSVKWTLVQFPADCAPNATQQYSLVSGMGTAEPATLMVEETDDGILVDTGALRVRVPAGNLVLMTDVQVVKAGATALVTRGIPLVFELEDGAVHTSDRCLPESVTVEESGPVRATIHVVGWLQGPDDARGYKLDARLRFYAGQSVVRADITFICLGQPELHHVKEIRAVMQPRVVNNPSVWMPGLDRAALGLGEQAVVAVDHELVCRVGKEGSLARSEELLNGWVVLSGSDLCIGLAVEDFRHLNPKAIEVLPSRITIALWSQRGGQILNLGRTRAKTHRLLLDFSSASDESAVLTRVRAFSEPLIAITPCEYLCATDALDPLSPEGAPETTAYDEKIRSQFAHLLRQRQELPIENGMLHYGDYYHGGYGNKLTRGDLEYDTGHACFLLYARSGNRDYYDFAVACNQHFIDIDVNQENGEQRYHGYSERAETHEAVTTGLESGHIFVDCPADAYYFTGDERSLDAVRMIADATVALTDGEGYARIRDVFAGAERQLGWPLSALCRAYEVVGDKRYLNAAEKIVAYLKTYAQDPLAAYGEGKWWRSWMMDGCKTFMTGELHDGLNAYYATTGEEDLRRTVVKSLDWLVDHMWNPEVGGFVYEFNAMNRGHRQTGNIGLNMLIVDAFRAGYEMTGDERYLSIATRAFASRVREMTGEVDGKQFSQDARTSPHTAAYFHRNGITFDSLPPAPQPVKQETPPRPVLPRPDVLLRADFEDNLACWTPEGEQAGEAVGKITFISGKRGKAVAVGNGGYARLPAPREMLMGPGTLAVWAGLHFKKSLEDPGQRALFHVEGDSPLIDSLGAVTIYDELRVRMKDHAGCLDGTAEGKIAQWGLNEWHHVAVTWDEKHVKLYLDGEEQVRGSEGGTVWDAVALLPSGCQTRINLGWRFGNWYCDCDLDELVVFGRALTKEEITACIRNN